MNCTNCQSPERKLWVLFGPHPKPTLTDAESGNWTWLQRCEQCGALWCLSRYEPYASFPYVVLWPSDRAAWRRVSVRDAGESLGRWHASMVREHLQCLPAAELAQVEAHRRRSYGRNPIDEPETLQTADLLA